MVDFGDRVTVLLKDGEKHSGVFIPSSDNRVITIKLDSGYNIAIPKDKIKMLTITSMYSQQKRVIKKTLKQNPTLPKIYVLHTGGTIASKVDYETGGVKPLFTVDELLGMFPELKDIANIETEQVFNVLSENMEFEHYNQLAKVISNLYDKADGFIITHGTDTIHYTAAALGFILKGLSKPVILVGSQRSSDRGSSDGALNMINAAYFIANTDFKSVGICMHATIDDEDCLILSSFNARKMHSSRRDAFRQINRQAVALVNFSKDKIVMHSKIQNPNSAQLKLKLFKPKVKVGLLKFRPGMQPEELALYDNFDGLVIEGTGFGHINVNNPDVVKQLGKMCKKMPVVMTSQCIYGRVNLQLYATGRKLLDMGVIPNSYALTPETAYIKLAWLLSNYQTSKVKQLFLEDFRGENIARITHNAYLS